MQDNLLMMFSDSLLLCATAGRMLLSFSTIHQP